ncbi:hypothetical protein, partial [uncultured Thioclava sp.]|uniref:hypothetical protein n=1 Tax=uncultured Thioclava sp. TaxID=473858 RepID=UPI0025DB026B
MDFLTLLSSGCQELDVHLDVMLWNLFVVALGLNVGECPELCVSVPAHAVWDTQASKRSPNIMANWLRAANHSLTFRP